MVTIKDSREISAALSRVWDVVADVDKDPKYWKGLNSVKNISKSDNVIEREVTVGFMNHKGRQTVVLDPMKSVEVTMSQGPMIGKRTTVLTPSGEDRTRIEISWNFEYSGIPPFVHGMVKREVQKGTEGALDRIAKEAGNK